MLELTSLTGFFATFALAFGLVIGSYLNVVVYRLPMGISTVFPGSRCSRCLTPIQPWDNVPVLSYLWLLARCRACRGKISIRYPLVEALTGLCFLLSYWKYPTRPLSFAVSSCLCAFFIVVGLIDWDRRQVPLSWVIAALAVGLSSQPWLGWLTPLAAFQGALIGGGALWLASEGWRKSHGFRGFESGDVWVIAAIGSFFGVGGVAVVFAGAAVSALILSFFDTHRPRKSVPFVTHLAIWALVFHFSDLLP